MKFEMDKNSIGWKMWADFFLLWKEHGNVHTIEDRDEWATEAYKLCEKYEHTDEWDLCRAIIDGMMDVISERMGKENKVA